MESKESGPVYWHHLYFAQGKTLALALTAAAMLSACAHSTPSFETSYEAVLVEEVERAEAFEPIPGSTPVPAVLYWNKYHGRKKYVGNGHCVKLVVDAVPALGNTGTWARGTHVYGDDSLEPGTPIATFDESGAYGNHSRGLSHAALYVRQSAAGLHVIDQWRPTRKSRGQRPRHRFIPWIGDRDTLPANTGVAFYVIHLLDSGERVIASEADR